MQEPKSISLKNRINYIDIARGISIILMILGHVIGPGWKRNIIFSFHMPLFVIVSGYFFKETENTKIFIKKNILKLVIPYLLIIFVTNISIMILQKTSFISMLIDTLKTIIFSYSYKGEFLKNINVTPIGVLWFMPTLLCSKIIFHILFKIKKLHKNILLLGITSFFISATGYYLGIKKIWLPFSFDISLIFIIFMYVGYILNKYNLLNKIFNNNAMAVLIVIIWLIGVNLGNIELAVRHYPLGILSFITAILGTISIFKLSELIDKYLKRINTILAWYGKNSMYILCFHHFECCIIPYNKLIKILNPSFAKLLKTSLKLIIVSLFTIIYNKLLILTRLKKKHISNI